MKDETLDEFLRRGGQIKKLQTPDHKSDTHSGYTWKDKIDVATGPKLTGAGKMFAQFSEAFLKRGNRNWKYTK